MITAQFNNLPKRRTLQTLWIVCQALIFPYFICSCAAASGSVPSALVFTLIWTSLQAVALGIIGWLLLTRQSWQTPQTFGGVLASCCWMASITLNDAIDIGYFNNQMNTALGGNVDAVRATIAFAVFLFLTYSTLVVLLWLWGDLLALKGGNGSHGGLGGVDSLQGGFSENDFAPGAQPIPGQEEIAPGQAVANNSTGFQAESL